MLTVGQGGAKEDGVEEVMEKGTFMALRLAIATGQGSISDGVWRATDMRSLRSSLEMA